MRLKIDVLREVDPKDSFESWNRSFDGILRELDARMSLYAHELVNTSESGLILTRHEICSNAKDVDFAVLLFELKDFLAVQIIACRD